MLAEGFPAGNMSLSGVRQSENHAGPRRLPGPMKMVSWSLTINPVRPASDNFTGSQRVRNFFLKVSQSGSPAAPVGLPSGVQQKELR